MTHPHQNLIDNWKRTKSALQAAQEAHLQSEIDLFNAVKAELPPKGTYHCGELKIVTGFTERWEQSSLQKLYTSWNAPVPFPFRGEWKADSKGISYIRDNLPQVYKQLSDCLTLTEKKPAFSVKGEKE